MLQATSPNKRNRPHDGDSNAEQVAEGESQATKRRAFLHTMGQQLREFGASESSPRDSSPRGPPLTSISGTTSSERAAGNQPQIQTPESDVVPGENDQLPSGSANSASQYLWRPNEVLLASPEAMNQIKFDDLIEWSRSYFDYWHPAYPFLHAPSLLEYFHHIVRAGINSSSKTEVFQLTILKSIFSISLADRRQTRTEMQPVPANLLFSSANDALSCIQWSLIEETSILSLQAVVSVQIFLISMLRFNAASRLEGLAVRMTVQLGLHRCPVRLSSLEKEAEIRKRLFWSIYCIDRYTCIRLGIPLAIRDDDVDVCLPSLEHHTESNAQLSDHDNRLNMLEFLAKHAEIRGSIMSLRNKPSSLQERSEGDPAISIDARLTKWWNEVDDYLESNDAHAVPISSFHQVILIVLRYESIMALNRSVLATSERNSAYHSALQNCIAASRSVINILYKTLTDNEGSDVPRRHPSEKSPLLWPSFTWAVWMSAFIILFAANEDQVSQSTASRLTERSLSLLEHLSLRGTNWPDACSVAIRNIYGRFTEKCKRSTGPPTASRSEETRREVHLGTPHPRSGTNVELVPTPSDMSISQHRHHNIAPVSRTANSQFGQERQGSFGVRDSDNSNPAYDSHPRPGAPLGAPSISDFTPHNPTFSEMSSLPGSQIAFPGSYLGIAQPLSDNPISNDEILDLFHGSDIPLWMGDDQYPMFGGNF